MGGHAIGEALEHSNYLENIYAKHNDMRDESAKVIADGIKAGFKIVRLDLSSNLFNDAGGELIAEALKDDKSLQYLNLAKNNLRAVSGSLFAENIKSNHTIKVLNLSDNCITNDFLSKIAIHI